MNSRCEIPFNKAQKKYKINETALENFYHLKKKDLSLCHDEKFIEKVSSDPDEVVYATYELKNEDGSFNRFNPEAKTKPLSDFIEKAMIHVNGTYLTALAALENGFCYHLGGGMHHAMSHRPGGFCMFNDIILTIRKLQNEGKIKKALVIDMDAHKGDGTAQVSFGDESIKTYSIHMRNGWPLNDVNSPESQTPSSMDVEVDYNDDYNAIFSHSINTFLSGHCENKDHFDFCIVVHGADVYEHDELPSSNLIRLSIDEVFKRDEFIFKKLEELKIPQAWVMAGGYGQRTHEVIWQFLDYALKSREA